MQLVKIGRITINLDTVEGFYDNEDNVYIAFHVTHSGSGGITIADAAEAQALRNWINKHAEDIMQKPLPVSTSTIDGRGVRRKES